MRRSSDFTLRLHKSKLKVRVSGSGGSTLRGIYYLELFCASRPSGVVVHPGRPHISVGRPFYVSSPFGRPSRPIF